MVKQPVVVTILPIYTIPYMAGFVPMTLDSKLSQPIMSSNQSRAKTPICCTITGQTKLHEKHIFIRTVFYISKYQPTFDIKWLQERISKIRRSNKGNECD